MSKLKQPFTGVLKSCSERFQKIDNKPAVQDTFSAKLQVDF